MLTIELPTRTRDYVIAIRDMPREDALTLSYLATRLGSDMLGARAARRVEPDGFTVMWSSADTPARGGQPDIIVTGGALGDARGTAVLGVGRGRARRAGADRPGVHAGRAAVRHGGVHRGDMPVPGGVCGTGRAVPVRGLCAGSGRAKTTRRDGGANRAAYAEQLRGWGRARVSGS